MIQAFKRKIAIFMLALMPLFMTTSCNEEGKFDLYEFLRFLMEMTGWNKGTEDVDIPDIPPFEPEDVTKTSISLVHLFPPVGDQGRFGTCVTWATGYGVKSALNKTDGVDFITSPIDLWHLIPSGSKGRNCGGTNFEPAFDALIRSGAAAHVPFNNTMTCDGVTGTGNANNKLESYRIIAFTKELSSNGPWGMEIANFKGHLIEHGPIAFGAQLGERFMDWNNASILSHDTDRIKGQHAYHAMVLVGFDDDKKAFRVLNSWGTTWGDNGFIWIDYDFFVRQFCFGAWIAANPEKTLSASTSLRSSGSTNDLQMEVLKDYETTDGSRVVEYNIQNTGSGTINADKNWSAVYLLFRKNRLTERYILFQDLYSNEGSRGKISSNPDGFAVSPSGNTITNVNIVPGSSAAEAMGGTRFAFEYTLPLDKNGNKLDGDFYMVLIADAFGNVDEMERENNISFLTGRNGEPIKIVDGKITNIPTQLKDIRTLVSESTPNNYSGIEIQQTLQRQFKNGRLTRSVHQESGLRSGRVAKQVK